MRHDPPAELVRVRGELHRWLRGRVRRRGLAHHLDDLLATADLALVEASRRHDPDRGPLGPLALQHAKRDTLRFLARERRANPDSAPDGDLDLEAIPSWPSEPLPQAVRERLTRANPRERLVIERLLDQRRGLKHLAAAHGLTEHRLRRETAVLLAELGAALDPDRALDDRALARCGVARKPTEVGRPHRPHLAEVRTPQRPLGPRRDARPRPSGARPAMPPGHAGTLRAEALRVRLRRAPPGPARRGPRSSATAMETVP
jgi:hypothetical protein